MAKLEFDPRLLISPPYITCPKGHKDSFGVLSIHGKSYTRRCRECFVSGGPFPLPEVKKKIIYIDQFAISNMMKALNDEMESHDRAKADPFWLELFDALERVCKLQLAVCPASSAHRNESLMRPYFDSLKRMYDQLSHGISFNDAASINDYQINMALLAWMKGDAPVHDLDPERMTSGTLHEWRDRLLITVEMKWPDDVVEGIRKFRDGIHEKMADVFEYYKKRGEREKDFGFWFEHERQQGADAILIAAGNYGQRLRDMIESGDFDLLKLDGYRSKGYNTFEMIRTVMLGSGIKPEDVLKKIGEFLESEAYRDAPANRISALMWAAIAHQAAHGRKSPPNQGMSNDIETVSTLMPYCDAMLMDRECAALLGNIPKKFPIGFETRIFSPATRAEFLAYLKQIEDDADKGIVAAVSEVYGDTWLTPFREMYKIERARKGS